MRLAGHHDAVFFQPSRSVAEIREAAAVIHLHWLSCDCRRRGWDADRNNHLLLTVSEHGGMNELVPVAVALEPFAVFRQEAGIGLPDGDIELVHRINLMRGIAIPVPSSTPSLRADAVIVNHRSGMS